MKKEKFDVQGMTCSSCSAHVEKAVYKLEGVKNVNVNLLSNNMIVEYDEQKLNSESIIKEVIDAGYGARISSNDKKTGSMNKKENIKDEELSRMKKRLIWSILLLIPLMYIAMFEMLEIHFGINTPEFIKNIFTGVENALIYAFVQFLILIPIVCLNKNYFVIGFKHLIKKAPNMDTLIAIGSSASILYSIYGLCMIFFGFKNGNLQIVETYSKNLYFESAGTILTLITVGKFLETKSKRKTNDAIRKLIDLTPKTAIVFRNGKEIEINTNDIIKGDIVIIKPGNTIPVDGKVIEGKTSINQSAITGESIPVEKQIGETVISGTINQNGYIKIQATKVGEECTLAQIIKLVEEASNSKAPIARIADKVSGVFVPIVILIAVIATVFWILQGQNFEFALSIGISILVISCPCALGLATPVAIMVGTGKGAENGILIKSAEALETLHSIDTVILDKTGTITKGKPTVNEVITSQDLISNLEERNKNIKVIKNLKNIEIAESELLKIAGSLEKVSEHPLANAILEKAKERKIEILDLDEFETVPGRGIKGKIKDVKYFVGNLEFMKENEIDIEDINIEKFLEEGKTVIYIAKQKNFLGIITVSDIIKESSKIAIDDLQKRNIDIIMLTGDNEKTAKKVANILNLKNVISEVLPQDKEKEVLRLQEKGKKVAFVGDGINDSPALTRANVGLAIGAGADIAIDSADIVLTKNDLTDVVTAIDLSKAVIKNIKMNLFWAFFYNAIGIPVAAGVFYLSLGFKLNPMIGAAAMSLSSVCVVTNALRLKKFKSNKFESNKKDNSGKTVSLAEEKDAEKNNKKAEENKMKTIKIEGMSCNHCKMSVEKALNSIEGISKVEVDLEKKQAVIESNVEIENDKIKEVIEEQGFEVKDIK